MKLQTKNQQRLRLTFNQKLLTTGSLLLLVVMILLFFWVYFKSGKISEADASHNPAYNFTQSLTFEKNGQEYFHTDQISPELNAISFWIYTPTAYTGNETTSNRIIGALDEKNHTMGFGSVSSNVTGETFTIQDNNGCTAIKSKIPKGWNHITINYTGTVGDYNSTYEIYLNGEKQTTTHGHKSFEKINAFEVYFGKRGSKNNDYYHGAVDELAVWNAPLSDSLIKQLPYTSFSGSEADLEAYYRFNKGTGNAEDLTHNGYTGNITNASIWVDSSNAAIGDSLAQRMNETRGLYHNKDSAVSGELQVSGNLPDDPYVVFGHDNGSGVKSQDAPSSPSYPDFQRLGRSWYFDTFGGQNIQGDLAFDVNGLLKTSYQNSNYVLLKRSSPSNNFNIAAEGADTTYNTSVEFNNVTFGDGYYTIGVKDTTNLTTGATLKTPSHAGKSLNFSGSGEAHFPTIYNEMQALQFWIYTPNQFDSDQTTSNRYIGSPAKGVEMIFGEANSNVSGETFTIQDANGSTYITDTIEAGWHQITLNWDNGQNRYNIYIDGIQKSLGSAEGECGLISSPELMLGKIYNKSNYYDGEIDHVAIWNSSLTQQQIRNHMCKRLDGTEANLAGLWHTDNSDALTVFDHVNSKNVRLIGGVSKNTSGADLGVNSKYVYNSGSWSSEELLFARNNGDTFKVNNITGNPTSLQIYVVDTIPNSTNAGGDIQSLSENHHFGVNMKGDASATYDIVYEYSSSTSNEDKLALAYRSDNATTSWSESSSSLDTSSNTVTLANQSGTQYSLATKNSTALPVELVAFDARYDASERQAKLEWATAAEENNRHFKVQRSMNDNNFKNIGLRKGHGTTTEAHEYQFKDDEIPENQGVVYYRLKQVDYDGSYEYSSIKSVQVNKDGSRAKMALYPNPFQNRLFIEMDVDEPQNIKLQLFDQGGTEIESHFATLKPGKDVYRYVPGGGLEKGIYYLKVHSSDQQNHFKVIKQ